MTRLAAMAIVPAAGALLLAAAACGGGSSGEPDLPPLPPPATATPGAHTGEVASPSAALSPAAGSPSPAPTTTATAVASPTPVPDAGEPGPSAAAALGARLVSPLTAESCRKDNPAGQPCIDLSSNPATVAGGLAVFRGGYPDGGPFTLVMARQGAAWRYWYSTQQPLYQLLALPGSLIACADPVQIAASPGGPAGTNAAAGTRLAADRLELVKPGEPNASRGEAWYHITAPNDGWVRASDVTDASLGDCRRRNEIEQERPRG